MTDDRDNEGLEAISARLESERPVPSAAFRGALQRRLLAAPPRRRISRRQVRVLVTVYAGSGLALFAIAVTGLAGAGPLAP